MFASIALQNFDQAVRLLMLYVVEGNPLPVAIEFCKKYATVYELYRGMDQNAAIIGKFKFCVVVITYSNTHNIQKLYLT